MSEVDPDVDLVCEIAGFSGRLLPGPSPLETVHRAAIADNWAAALREKPQIFNGRVLVGEAIRLKGGVADVAFRAVDFATLLWLRSGRPPAVNLFNVFGAAAVMSCDGAILLGRMAAHTANAGAVYFPAGTPDLGDVNGDAVNLESSILRELEEETGLAPPLVEPAETRLLVARDGLVALVRLMKSPLDAATLARVVTGRLAMAQDAELDGVALVHGPDELDERSPAYVHAALDRLFGPPPSL